MKRCINPNCGAELDDSAKFCLECGTKQPQEYVCPACGAKFEQPSKFCMECGAKMDGTGGAPKASGMSIGDNNAISAKDIIGGNKIEAQNYTVTNVMGPQKSEAEHKMEDLSMKRMSKEYIREEMAKAKDYESHNNYYHAVSIYRELAADDNVDAVCALLSLDYNKQFTIEASERNSLMNKLSEAVNSGHPTALFLVGVNTINSDYSRGLDYLNRAIQNGSKKAVDYLDRYYGYNDDGTRKEVTEEAFRWFEKSAEMGSAEGQYNLAFCYNKGVFVEKMHSEAYKLLQKSAQQNYAEAQYMLGEYYFGSFYGDGASSVPVDKKKAVELFRKAAEQGMMEAQVRYGMILYDGIPNYDIKSNQYEAAKWLVKAAERGDMVAQCYYGRCCNAYKDALVWLKKSAEQGYMPAYTEIGYIYKDMGQIAAAIEWLKPAAESGDEFAQSQYGVCCANHYDLSEAGIKEAGKYLRMAADRGDEEAIDTIKDCYLELDYGWDMKAIDWLAGKVEKDPEVWGWAKKMIGRCYSDLIKYGYSDGTELNEEEKQYAKQQAQKWGTGISSSILASHREAQQTTSQPAHQTKPQPAPQPAAPTKTEASSGSASKVQVVLITAGAQKLFVVKEVKEYLNIGLKEAMDLVSDKLPNVIAELDENKAKEFYNILKDLGANVELRQGGETKVKSQPVAQPEPTTMSSSQTSCPQCGLPRENNIRFCPGCSYDFGFSNQENQTSQKNTPTSTVADRALSGQSLIDIDNVKDSLKEVKNTVKGIFGKLFK